MAENGLKWPFLGCHVTIFRIFEFSQIYQYHEVMDTSKLHHIYKNQKILSSTSTRLKDQVFLGQMLKKHPIPSVFNPLIENRKRFPIKEFQPFLQENYFYKEMYHETVFRLSSPRIKLFFSFWMINCSFKANNALKWAKMEYFDNFACIVFLRSNNFL